jgi:hypothetical protein
MTDVVPANGDTFMHSLKTRVLAAFTHLPYIIICFVGFLAMGLGSIGLFVLFIGQIALLPVLVYILRFITDAVDALSNRNLFHIYNATDDNTIIPGIEGSDNVGPTYWTAHITFFLGYLLANAVSIYNVPADPLIDKNDVKHRMRRARTIIIATILLALILPFLRFRLTGGGFVDNTSLLSRFIGGVSGGAETLSGITFALVVCGGVGYAWYKFAESCGARAADVFGIAQQIIPYSAKDETPMACVYSPKP